jgi:hypothetical protein
MSDHPHAHLVAGVDPTHLRKLNRLTNRTARLHAGTDPEGRDTWRVSWRGPRGQHVWGPMTYTNHDAVAGAVEQAQDAARKRKRTRR